jgi:hypothetical protein
VALAHRRYDSRPRSPLPRHRLRPNVEKLTFLDKSLRQRIATNDGYTVLNEWFESSVPGLFFTGAIAGYNFGAICRAPCGDELSERA